MTYIYEQYQGENVDQTLHTANNKECVCKPFEEKIETYNVETDIITYATSLVHQDITTTGVNNG